MMRSEVATFVVNELAKQGVPSTDPSYVSAQSLSSLGIDSLDFMELLNEIEEKFLVRIEDDTVSASTTVGELIAFIEHKVAARATASPSDRT